MAVNHAKSVFKEKKRRDAKESNLDNLKSSEADRRKLLESVRARDSLRR